MIHFLSVFSISPYPVFEIPEDTASVQTALGILKHSHLEAPATLGAFPFSSTGCRKRLSKGCMEPHLWHLCKATSPWKSPSLLPSVRGTGA